MYENNTEELIFQRMMQKLPSDVDKSESSPIVMLLSPVSNEIARAYAYLQYQLNYVFPSELTPRDYLDKIGESLGVIRKSSTYCIKKANFFTGQDIPMDVLIGGRFYVESFVFYVSKKIGPGIFEVTSEVAGKEVNNAIGSLVPVDYIEGLTKATIVDMVLAGQDIEDDASYLARIKKRAQEPSTSGNDYDYIKWSLEVTGVGKVRIKSKWNGRGTVKVVIADSNNRRPSQDVITNTYNHIESLRPVGPTITVVGATELAINVNVSITKDASETIDNIKSNINSAIDKYLRTITFEEPMVKISMIIFAVLGVKGVTDYTSITINGQTGNIPLNDEQVAILGSVVVNVA
ncbi:MAG: baseplate J/gp47 family protein [Clostridium sp.]